MKRFDRNERSTPNRKGRDDRRGPGRFQARTPHFNRFKKDNDRGPRRFNLDMHRVT